MVDGHPAGVRGCKSRAGAHRLHPNTAARVDRVPMTRERRSPRGAPRDGGYAMPQDPRERGPKPPHPFQQQEPPGLESEMDPKPDYGEEGYKGSGKLEGEAAVITGGDSGIGRAVALAFAREGADVLISYLSEESDARETARVIEAAGR